MNIGLKNVRKLLLAGISAAAIGVTGAAYAVPTALTYNLTCTDTTHCNGPSWGTITLTNNANGHEVDVGVNLLGGAVFAGTGAGDAIAFNVGKAVTLTNIQPAGTFVVDASPKGVPFGNFQYGIDYTGSGTSPPTFTSFSFSTNDGTTLTVQDFVANAAGFFFVSDIGIPKVGGGFNTQNVASNGTNPPPIPEPLSISLLGAGLAAVGTLKRRRQPA